MVTQAEILAKAKKRNIIPDERPYLPQGKGKSDALAELENRANDNQATISNKPKEQITLSKNLTTNSSHKLTANNSFIEKKHSSASASITRHQTKHNRRQQDTNLNTSKHSTEHNQTQNKVLDQTHPNTTAHIQDTTLNTTRHNQTRSIKRTKSEAPNTIPDTTKHLSEHIEFEKSFFSLTGNPYKAMMKLSSYCIDHFTNKIEKTSYVFLAGMIGINVNSIKTTLRRLKLIGFFEIQSPKGGKGSTISLIFKNETLALYSKYTNAETKHKLNTLPNTLVSSSSSINNNLTTTRESSFSSDESFTGEWATIQIPNVLQNLNIDSNIVNQVKRGKLCSPQELQKSLDAYAFDVEVNNFLQVKSIRDPIGFFMGIIRKSKVYSPPSNFKSLEDKAMEEILERQKDKLDQIERTQNELKEIEFKIWLEELSEEEKKSPLLYHASYAYMGSIHNAKLRDHFEKEIWPKKWEGHRKKH